MIPLIIESNNQDQIDKYLSEKYLLQNVVFSLRPEENSIKLPAIKYLIDRAKFSPGQKTVVFLIYDGHLITPAGQNALLKTLEESKLEQQFVILTTNHHLLLDTVISRCQLVVLKGEEGPSLEKENLNGFISYLKTDSSCLQGTDAILSDDPKSYLTQLVRDLRRANHNIPTAKRVKVISLLADCLSDLDRNINPKLAVDHFMLTARKIINKAP